MKTRVLLVLLSLGSYLGIQAQIELNALNFEITADSSDIFWEDILVSSDNSCIALFSLEKERGSAVIVKWDQNGILQWQKSIRHQRTELNPIRLLELANGAVGIAFEDFEFSNDFSQGNISWVEISENGDLVKGLRFGNQRAQTFEDGFMLDDQRLLMMSHFGINGQWGTHLSVVNLTTLEIEKENSLKGGILTYLNKVIPVNGNQYLAVGSNTLDGGSRQAAIVLLDDNFDVVNDLVLEDSGTITEATFAIERGGEYQVFFEKDGTNAYVVLDQSLNILESKEGLFGEVNYFQSSMDGGYSFSSRSGNLNYSTSQDTFAKTISTDRNIARAIDVSKDEKYVWGIGSYFDGETEHFEGLIKLEALIADPFCNSYNGTIQTYQDMPVNLADVDFLPEDMMYLAIQDTTGFELTDFEGTVTETCRDFVSNLDEVSLNSFKVYPNPVVDVISIELEENAQGRLEILDLNGHSFGRYPVVGNKIEVDLSHLEKGVYLIQIGANCQKFVKI